MKLFANRMGQGPPVIIMHGLLGMSDNWMTVGRRLAERYSVFLLDLRNHGQSPHAPDISYPLMAGDVAEFMRDHELSGVRLVGHSMGGKVAMQTALSHPQRVSHLVVVDMSPRESEDPFFVEILKTLGKMDPGAFPSRQEADAWLATYIQNAGVRQFLLKNLSRDHSGGSYRWKMNLEALINNHKAISAGVVHEGRYEGPTLFVRGGESGYVVEADLGPIHGLFPEARLETVEGAGHWVHAERPEAVITLLEEFLAD